MSNIIINEVYVKLNKDKIFDNIDSDIEVLNASKEKIAKRRVTAVLIGIVAGVLTYILDTLLIDSSMCSSIAFGIIIGAIIMFAAGFIMYMNKAIMLTYSDVIYCNSFVEEWSENKKSMRYETDNKLVFKWLTSFSCASHFIPNAEYIRAVLDNNFICYLDDAEEGTIMNKATGEQFQFYIDNIISEVSEGTFNDMNTWVLLICEKEHILIDKNIYESSSICETECIE